ncbi:hypothetical protein FRB96_008957 [Tulasnella sp. 330]|nr:hypothetical protein FRB96_008957 [Tulasnella sp. 330]KAG8873026.1 hypothetical protein FRB97_007075 [Tulasnella sp. 331]KAG8878249.1 hypothetical protein FRB98_006300 [Tulasnella sp. 332]
MANALVQSLQAAPATKNPPPRWSVRLNNLRQKGLVTYNIAEVANGPGHQEEWTVTIEILKICPTIQVKAQLACLPIYCSGSGRTKGAANINASYAALEALDQLW